LTFHAVHEFIEHVIYQLRSSTRCYAMPIVIPPLCGQGGK